MSNPIKGLPIKASVTTRSGFHKSFDIQKMDEYISLPFFLPPPSVVTEISANTLPTEETIKLLHFKLVRYRIVAQKNGLKHVVAVYRECP